MVKKATSILLICTLCVLVCFVNIAEAGTIEPTTERENELFLARQDLSNTAYTNMLWAFAEGDVNKLERTYPEYYAGAYIGDNGNLVILTKDATEENISELNSVCNYSGIIYKAAEHSYNELLSVMHLVSSRAKYIMESDIFDMRGYKISVLDDENKIFIGIENPADMELVNFLTDGLKTSYYYVGKATPFVDTATLEPGGYISSLGQGSVAYKARLTYNGEIYTGFMTAGHVTGIQPVYNSNGFLATKVGRTILYQNEGYADAAFVELIEPHTFNNVVEGYQITPGVTVMPAVSSTVYKWGASSGRTSGTVKSTTNITEWDTDGNGTDETVFYNLLEHRAYCENGDSGGLVYTKTGTTYKVAGIVKSRAYDEEDQEMLYYATKAAHVPWNVEVIS